MILSRPLAGGIFLLSSLGLLAGCARDSDGPRGHSGQATRTLQVYDATKDGWEVTPPMPERMGWTGAVLVGQRFYVTDGRHFFRYKHNDRLWERLDLPSGVADTFGDIALLGTNIYMMNSDASTWVFDTNALTWAPGPPQNLASTWLQAGVAGGLICVIGRAPDKFEVLDPAVGVWETRAHTGNSAHTDVVGVGDVLYKIGPGTVSRFFDTNGSGWLNGPPLPLASNDVESVAIGTDVYAIGNFVPEREPMVFRLDTNTLTWERVASHRKSRNFSGVAAKDDRIFVFGGTAIRNH